MFWKFANSRSIVTHLLMIFIIAVILILFMITALIYPPLKEILNYAHLHHEQYTYLLTQICIKKFFIGLWLSTIIIIFFGYLLAKKSMRPIKNFTQELASIHALSLNKRLQNEGYPKELKQLAATCNDMLLRLENAFIHIKQFSASMAHELKNPIHYLQTATEVTLTTPQSVEAYQEVLHTHLETYQHLTRLIDKLLFLTRSEHGQIPLQKQRLSANRLIHGIVEYYHFTAEEKNIAIQVSGDAVIEVDEHLFKRVIANLIDNSLKYTQEGGNIAITIEEKSSHIVHIILEDNGIGIEKAHLERLCQGFYRGAQAKSPETASMGLGLGLAIARSIMENHCGRLEITSEPGGGTRILLVTVHADSPNGRIWPK